MKHGYCGTYCSHVEKWEPRIPDADDEAIIDWFPVYCGNIAEVWDEMGYAWCPEHSPTPKTQ